MISFLVVPLLFFSLLSRPSAAAASWFSFPSIFPKHRFTSSGEHLIDISSLSLPKTGIIASWGDFNQDQLNDLVHLSYDQRSLSVWLWDRKNYVWKEDEKKRIKTKSDFIVTNVVSGDFNFDGKLDLLLYGEKPGGWWGSDKEKTTDMKVYLQTNHGNFSESIDLESSTLSQAIPVSLSSSLKTSLLGFSPSSGGSLPILWENTSNSSSTIFTSTPLSSRLDYSSHPTGDWSCSFPHPHSNAFVDLDGDCMADLFFTCLVDPEEEDKGLRYEVWTNEKLELGTGEGGKFVWKRGGDLPKGTKSVSFADMDRDGTIDMILSVCPHDGNNKDCSIQIAYNDQIPLCTSQSQADEECRDLENLCTKDESFQFPDLTSPLPNPSLSILPLSTLIPSHNLLTSSLSFQGPLPTPPQIGDYNIDGYPDLLLLVSPTSHPSQRIAKLLRSYPCSEKGKCSQGEIEMGRRRWEVVSGGGVEALEKFKDIESVGWVDLDDDGSLDIVVQRSGQSGAARQINFIKNNFFNDAFFLKAMMLNGACNGWCEPKEPGQSRYRPYGTSYSGASFKFTVLDPTGARRSTQYNQLSQTSYLSLPLPYAHLGLGRTNNYVENLFIGSPRSAQPQHYINLEGVIPNSQVLVIPWQSREGEDGDTGEWKKELYLKPGDWIPWVTVVILTGIVGLGIVVLVLHLNEKREDEIERRARLLSLNFQAL